MNRIKGLIFDLDGTLADTLPDLQTGMNEMLRGRGYPERDRRQLLAGINRGAREFVRSSLPEELRQNEELLDDCYAEYSACYARHCNENTVLFDRVADGVYALKAMGMKLAVLSNKQDAYTKQIIEKLFCPGTFDFVLGHIDGGLPHKPDPASSRYTAKMLGLDPSEMIFVGDSNVDMETAAAVGMDAYGVVWGYRPPEYLLECGAVAVVDDISLLCDIIRKRNGQDI